MLAVKSANAFYMWLAVIAAGIIGNFVPFRYRRVLYNRNTDYPEFHALQRIQLRLYWVTIAVMVAGVLWFLWVRLRRR